MSWFKKVKPKEEGLEFLEQLKKLKAEGLAEKVREGIRNVELALKVSARLGKTRVEKGFWEADTLNAISEHFESRGFEVKKGLSHFHDQSFRLTISWKDED